MSPEDQIREVVDQVRRALTPSEEIQLRVGLPRRQWRALLILLAAALGLSLVFYALSRPRSEEIAVRPAPATTTLAVEIVVDVAGKVAEPGVYRLSEGSRAIDAITAAGGVLPGVTTENINLAHVLTDGEQLLVGATASSSTQLLDLNSATIEELDRLPGVGPVLAQRIISWRIQHGRFRAIDDIKKVPGVGAATFADLKPLIRV